MYFSLIILHLVEILFLKNVVQKGPCFDAPLGRGPCRLSIVSSTVVRHFGLELYISNNRLLYKWTVHWRLVLKCEHHNGPQHQYEIKVN